MKTPVLDESIEYNDNRLSLFSAQLGKCAITKEVLDIGEIHCHHKLPRKFGGDDKYKNLIIVKDKVHRLIHSTNPDKIKELLNDLNLSEEQIRKVNTLRRKCKLDTI